MLIEEKLKIRGLILPQPPKSGGIYTPIREFGGHFAYASGFGPANGDKAILLGKLGKELSVEEGREMARYCILNMLAAFKHAYGDFERIKRFVKLLVFVSSENTFYEQPQVANGASGLITELFGEEAGLAARSAIGVNVLPGNIPVEIEALIELKS